MTNHDHQTTASVTVRVPVGTEDFITRIAALIVEMGFGPHQLAPAVRADEASDAQLLESATNWWASLAPMERAIFNLWIEAAPRLVDAQVMVDELGLTGMSSIRGHIRRVTQKAGAVGFQAGWQSHKRNPLTGHRLYGLRDFGTGEFDYDRLDLTATDYAALLMEARRIAEGN